MGMLALTHNAPAEYFMFSVLIAVMLVTYGVSRMSVRAVTVERETSSRVFENEPLSVHLALANRGRFPRFLIDVSDSLPDFMEAEGDRDFVVPSLWPGEQVTLSYTARAAKRGAYRWRPLQLSASDPFGVFPRYTPLSTAAEAIVYPRPIELRGSLRRAGAEAQGQSSGERTRGPESGMDFYGVRDYQSGDELRRIHWPVTARHGKLTVIEFDRGASENVAVLLDTSAGSEFGSGLDTTLEAGVRAAASLVHWAVTNEGVGRLGVASLGGPQWVNADSADHEHDVLEALARVKADGPTAPSALLTWAAPHLMPDENVILITAGLDDALPAAISGLVKRRASVGVLMLNAPSFDPAAPDASGVADALRAMGAEVISYSRGENLAQALADVIGSGE